jgi:hypothetical protein
VGDLPAKLTPAPEKKSPKGMADTEFLAKKIFPSRAAPIINWSRENRKKVLAGSLVMGGIAAVTGFFLVGAALGTAGLGSFSFLTKRARDKRAAEGLMDPAKELPRIPATPQQSKFSLHLSDEAAAPPATTTTPGRDSVEAKNFRNALIDIKTRLAVDAPTTSADPFKITDAHSKVIDALNPNRSFPFRLSSHVKFPGDIKLDDPKKIFPAIAYPDFENPMYKGLTAISDELLLPNVQLIPPNTISLLKTNSKFIESYMVGLNHEMGRELLWREYPTDERGSYFRQFWDVKGVIAPDQNESQSQTAERHKDIDPIHTWDIASSLGSHNKQAVGGQGEQLVLVIRGDLLKRYPNTVILAQKAMHNPNGTDPIINTTIANDQDFKEQIKFPLYKAEILPDIKFFGFDLTVEQARGTTLSSPFADNLGWFFVIQETPGEPRFGMDISANGQPATSWDDLAWDHFDEDLEFVKASVPPAIDPEATKWGRDAAEMAYILFQKPSMVAVHAKDMLANLTA